VELSQRRLWAADVCSLDGKCRRFGRTGCEWKRSYAAREKERRVGEVVAVTTQKLTLNLTTEAVCAVVTSVSF